MSSPPSRRAVLATATLVAVAAGLVALFGQRWLQAPPPDTVTIGAPFALTASDGRTVTDADYRGRYMLVTFGFTHCPDVCPTTLAAVATALDRLGDKADRVQPILITVDPERDTPAVLAAYVQAFHPRLIGLTGGTAEIEALVAAYRVYAEKAAPDATGDYQVDHTAAVFLMDPDGRFLTLFSSTLDAEALAAGLNQYVDG